MTEPNNPFVEALSHDKETIHANNATPAGTPFGEQYVNPAAEKFISGLATLLLVIGIVGCFILLLTAIAEFSDDEPATGWLLLGSGFGLLLASIIQWALLRVFVNISRNLFNIHSVLKERR